MKNILIIDNSELVVNTLKAKLEEVDFNVYCCNDIVNANSYLKESFIDFFGVIIEINIPNVTDKIEFIKQFTNKNYATIILTTYDNQEFIKNVSNLNIIDYIIKKNESDLDYAALMMQRIYSYQDHKVLIVDDSKVAVEKAKKNLEILKLKTLIAYDGVEALEVISRHRDISLVLTDFNMPNMNGFELTLALRKEYSKNDLIIIAITAANNPKIATMFLKYGANGYVSKNCTKNELNYTINNLMDILNNKQKAIKSRQQLQKYTTQLSKYVSPQIYESIVDNKSIYKIDSKRQKLIIFFIHIDSFTSITDIFESNELTYWLNEYLTIVSDVATKYGATIDKFVGDMVMGFFGAPNSFGLQEDALLCMKMILEIQKKLKPFRKMQTEEGVLHPFFIKCGIANGFVTVGNFGSKHRMDYTIIGGFVNLASRLCDAAKKNEVLITQETYTLVRKYLHTSKSLKIKAKGFSKLIQTYTITSLKSNKELSDESNLELKQILATEELENIEIENNVLKLISKIKGVNDE